MKVMWKSLIACCAALIIATGCATPPQSVIGGATTGATIGAGIGSRDHKTGEGAAIGAGVGAVVAYLLDRAAYPPVPNIAITQAAVKPEVVSPGEAIQAKLQYVVDHVPVGTIPVQVSLQLITPDARYYLLKQLVVARKNGTWTTFETLDISSYVAQPGVYHIEQTVCMNGILRTSATTVTLNAESHPSVSNANRQARQAARG